MTTVLHTKAGPQGVGEWLAGMWAHGDVLRALARTDFHVRYKRAAFGIAWAVLLPVLQASVLAVVFSRVLHVGSGNGFPAFVLAGVTAWGYFAQTLTTASTSIVDGSGLTDKVWFPRALLPLASAAANLVGMAVSVLVLIGLAPLLGGRIGVQTLWLVPAVVLLVTFTASLSLVLAALYVYFRDVKFIVQAALLVWFYVTPILYPPSFIGGLRPVLDANPMTAVVLMFHAATVPSGGVTGRALVSGVGITVVLAVIAVEAYRRHDRLFVDQL